MRKVLLLLGVLSFLIPVSHTTAQEINFLIQGEVYTPAFYKGGSPWTNQSRVTILAIPQIPGVTNPSALNYKWTKNSVVQGTGSGVGRNFLVFSDSVLGKSQTIKLEILSLESAILASETITITPRSPSILVYEDSPLYGILFHKEVGSNHNLKDQEVTFAVFPLFFSTPHRFSGHVDYSWRTNTGDRETKNSVTYRTPEGVSGSSKVTVKLEHSDRIIQASGKSFVVQFGQ